jgi:hypothetical protein
VNSFALWFDPNNNGNTKIDADVHFNLWNLHYRKALPPCLDVGIRIVGIKGCRALNFYIPFHVREDEVQDLGKKLISSEILCSVFNEDYILARQGSEKILNVTDKDGKKVMTIYCLDEKNDMSIKQKFGGTLLSLSIPDTLKNTEETIYFRFRIRSKGFINVIKTYNPRNVFLQSAVSVIEAIDFRFNDYRSLNSSLLEQMRKGISYNIGKVHFLLLTEADVEINYSSITAMARELETNIWNGYFSPLSGKSIVAYHWKFKSGESNKLIENCIMFVKTKVHKCNWVTIGLYLLSLGIITVFFGWVAQMFF